MINYNLYKLRKQAELNKKKIQFFSTVLQNIAYLNDVDTIQILARKALDETFCEVCGTHPAPMICDSCGKGLCESCHPHRVFKTETSWTTVPCGE